MPLVPQGRAGSRGQQGRPRGGANGQVRCHAHQAPGSQGINQGGGVGVPIGVRCHALIDHPRQGRVVPSLQGPGQCVGVLTGSVSSVSVRAGSSGSTGGGPRAGGIRAGTGSSSGGGARVSDGVWAGSGGWCCSRKDLGGGCVRGWCGCCSWGPGGWGQAGCQGQASCQGRGAAHHTLLGVVGGCGGHGVGAVPRACASATVRGVVVVVVCGGRVPVRPVVVVQVAW